MYSSNAHPESSSDCPAAPPCLIGTAASLPLPFIAVPSLLPPDVDGGSARSEALSDEQLSPPPPPPPLLAVADSIALEVLSLDVLRGDDDEDVEDEDEVVAAAAAAEEPSL